MMLLKKHTVFLEGKVVQSFKAYWFLDTPIDVTFNKAENWHNNESHTWNHF